MDKKTLEKIEYADLLTWLVAQDDVRGESELLMSLISNFEGSTPGSRNEDEIEELKSAYRKFVFNIAAGYFKSEDTAKMFLDGKREHVESVIESGAPRLVEVTIR